MIEVLTDEIRTARKEYSCDASEYVREWVSEGMYVPGRHIGESGKVKFSDLRKIAAARSEGYKILKGSKYKYQRNKYDGDIYSFRGRIDMTEMCHRYKLWPEL